MADKNLDGNGLSEVWVRAAQLVKKYTGAVDSTKGDLQTQVNEKLSGTDDTKDNTVTFTSADESNPTAWKDVNVLSSNEKHSSILNKISNMFSNIRYLYKNVGGIKGLSSSSAITTQGEYALDAREKNASVEGTLANQISNLNSNLNNYVYKEFAITVLAGDIQGFITTDDYIVMVCIKYTYEWYENRMMAVMHVDSPNHMIGVSSINGIKMSEDITYYVIALCKIN